MKENEIFLKEAVDEAFNYILNKLEENKIYNIQIIAIKAYGSYIEGREHKESDIDILVEYSGSARKDFLFNLFHEDNFTFKGINVDINPITSEKTGTIEEYFERINAKNSQFFKDYMLRKIKDKVINEVQEIER